MSTHLEKRSFTTNRDWQIKKRGEKPIKGGEEKPHTIRDKLTGLKIMHSRDWSGYNHHLAIDGTFQNEHYFLVVGALTSSNKPIDGITPIKVGDILLNGVQKAQYFLKYPEPMLIVKEMVTTGKIDIVNVEHKTFFFNLPVPLKDPY